MTKADVRAVAAIAEDWFVGQPGLIGLDGAHRTDTGHAHLAAKIAPPIYRQLTTGI